VQRVTALDRDGRPLPSGSSVPHMAAPQSHDFR